MMDRKFYSGSNLDQALMKASRDLGIPKEEISYRQIEKKHGFLKMRRSIVIEVDPAARVEARVEASAETPAETPAEAPAEAAPEQAPAPESAVSAPPAAPPRESPREEPPREQPPKTEAPPWESPSEEPPQGEAARAEAPEAPPEVPAEPAPRPAQDPRPAEGDVADAIRDSLDMLLDLAGVEMEYSVEQGDERYEVELWGPDEEVLLRDNGRPLLSLQHLLVRLVRGMTGEAVYCRVDCDQFHEIREERLRDLAQRVASEVAAQHRSRLLESMAPDERRIVHMTLASDPHVETESQGDGYFKRVKIFPL